MTQFIEQHVVTVQSLPTCFYKRSCIKNCNDVSSSALVEQRATQRFILLELFNIYFHLGSQVLVYYKQLDGQLEAIIIEEALPDNWNGNVNGVLHA